MEALSLPPEPWPLDPEKTLIGLHPNGEFAESEKMMRVIRHNRQQLADFLGIEYEDVAYTPPAPPHYVHQWQHDSYYTIQGMSRHGSDEALTMAEREYDALVAWQDPETGFQPHTIFAPKGRKNDWERRRIYGKDAPTSCYTQPPDCARTLAEMYQARLSQDTPDAAQRALEELDKRYPSAARLLDWWDEFRTDGLYDKLKFIELPMITGADAIPVYDGPPINHTLLPMPNNLFGNITGLLNTLQHYRQMNAYELELHKHGWDMEWAKQHFAPRSLIINCIDAANRSVMAELAERLGKREDARKFAGQAAEVADQILERCYFAKDNDGDGIFFPLDKDGQPLRTITVESLYPLMLPNLKIEHLRSLYKVILKHFNTPLPFPSVATTEPTYDPHNRMKGRYERGPTWLHHNRLLRDYGLAGIVRRLVRSGEDDELAQGFADIAIRVGRASLAALDREGACEYFDPETGRGQHTWQVGRSFAWSAVAYTMLPDKHFNIEILTATLT